MSATLSFAESMLYPGGLHNSAPKFRVNYPHSGPKVIVQHGTTSVVRDLLDANFHVESDDPIGRATFLIHSGRVEAETDTSAEAGQESRTEDMLRILGGHLDLLFVSHPEQDHVSSLRHVMEAVRAECDLVEPGVIPTSKRAGETEAATVKVFERREQVDGKLYPTIGKVYRLDVPRRRILFRLDEARLPQVLALPMDSRLLPRHLFRVGQEFKAWATLRVPSPDRFWIGDFQPLERVSRETAIEEFNRLIRPIDVIRF